MRRMFALVATLALLATACSSGGTTAATTPTTTQAVPVTTQEQAAPQQTGPSDIVFSAQESDGATIVIDSVTVPTAGFIAVHGDADGKPGPIVGHSDLLAPGTTKNVVVALTTPLSASAKLFPMVHIDVNGNGEYEFFPPDTTIDVPGTFANGAVAVVGAQVTVEAAAAAGTLQISTSDLGTFLVDGDGNTLYLFIPDNQSDSTCYDACAQSWPPLTDPVTAGNGIDANLLGTTTRDDASAYQAASKQVTYNGWPLYYFAADQQAGDTNGQGVKDVWYVVDPTGSAVK